MVERTGFICIALASTGFASLPFVAPFPVFYQLLGVAWLLWFCGVVLLVLRWLISIVSPCSRGDSDDGF